MKTRGAQDADLISRRARSIDTSGIRRVFELGAKLSNPIDLSIGQPDFPVPEPLKEAAIDAIRRDRNGYTVTQGIPELREAIRRHLQADVGWDTGSGDLGLLVTSGTSGALALACLALLNPGDEVIVPDPYFVIYPALGAICGAGAVLCETYPDFRLTAERVEPLITPKTKLLMVNSPSNPSGVVLTGPELRDLVDLCRERDVLLVADEIYDQFVYDEAREAGRCPSPARFTDRMLLVRGFGKTYGCTGWRIGYAAGPRRVIEQMAKLQQYLFVCAPSMVQAAVAGAFELDVSPVVRSFAKRRDAVVKAFEGVTRLVRPGGAFYAFVEVPPGAGTASAFAESALRDRVLVIPGGVFSRRDTHFRLSFAVADDRLREGLSVLRRLMTRET